MKQLLLFVAAVCMLQTSYGQLPLGSATLDITLQCSGGTGNRTGISYNPNADLYYSVNAGSATYPIETFSSAGAPLFSTNAGFDYRGSWWNPNTNELEGNGFNTLGIWIHDLNGSSYALNTGTTDIGGVGGPNSQSSANYDWIDDEILYYNSGTIYRYTRATHALIGSVAVSGLPVPLTNLNSNSIAYTSVPGMEAGLYDHVTKTFYFLDKTTGAYQASCSLPPSAPAATIFKMGFANNRLWLYNTTTSQWEGYQTVSPCSSGPSFSSFSITACDSYTVPSGDETYSSAGTMTVMDTIPTVGGCDSIMTITLTINNSSTGIDVITACDSLVWTDGITYYADNMTATDTFTNVVGCDSVVTLNLTITNSTSATDVITACDSITWIDGMVYSASNNTATHILTNSVGCDSLVTLDLTINNSSAFTDVQSACTSYLWMDGNTYVSSNNTATYILTNSVGCDSVITLDLTINTDTTLTVSGGTITSNQASANSFQWIDCDTNTPIAGATTNSYTPTQNGNYALVIDNNGCTDTTECVNISGIGFEEIGEDISIKIYPNPSQGVFNVELNAGVEIVEVVIFNQAGQRVSSIAGDQSNQTSIDMSFAEKGVYHMQVTTASSSFTQQIIKQ